MADRGYFDGSGRRGSRREGYAPAGVQGGYPQPPQQGYPQGGYAQVGGQGYYPPQGGYQASAGNVTIRHPRTYQDVQNLIDRLRMREQVIVDFTTLNRQSVFRILDFLSGAIYALGGSVQQLGDNMFLFVPAGVAINIPPELMRK